MERSGIFLCKGGVDLRYSAWCIDAFAPGGVDIVAGFGDADLGGRRRCNRKCFGCARVAEGWRLAGGADVGRAGVGEVLLGRLYERKGHSQEARKEASC